MLFDQGLETGNLKSHESVAIELLGERDRYALRVKTGDLEAFNAASGLQLPQRVGASYLDGEILLLCLGPDEWLIISDAGEGQKIRQGLEQMATQFVISFTDVSHRNIGLTLAGSQAVGAINIGCPLDLSLERFPVGKVVRTVFEAAPIMLFRKSDEVFQMEFWRSYGPYVTGLLGRFIDDIETRPTG